MNCLDDSNELTKPGEQLEFPFMRKEMDGVLPGEYHTKPPTQDKETHGDDAENLVNIEWPMDRFCDD